MIQPLRIGAHLLAKAHPVKRIHGAGPVALRMAGYVFKHRVGKHVDILEHDGEHGVQRLFIELPNGDAVDEDFPFGGLEHARHQLHERGFSGAVHADDRKPLPLMDGEIKVPENVLFRARVLKAHVFEFDLKRIPCDSRVRSAALAQILIHEREEIVNVFAFAVDRARLFRKDLELCGKAQHGGKIHGKIRDGHPRHHIPHKDAVSCHVAQEKRRKRGEAQQEFPPLYARDDRSIGVYLLFEVIQDALFEAVKPHILSEGKIIGSFGVIVHAALRMADLGAEAMPEGMRFPVHPEHGGHMQKKRRKDPHALKADEHNVHKHRQQHGRRFKQRMVHAFYAVVVAVCSVHGALVLIVELCILGVAIAHGEVFVQHVPEVFKPQQPQFMIGAEIHGGFQKADGACRKEEPCHDPAQALRGRRAPGQLAEHELRQHHAKHRVNRRRERINPKVRKKAFILPPRILHEAAERFAERVRFFHAFSFSGEMNLLKHSHSTCVKQGAVAQPFKQKGRGCALRPKRFHFPV